MKSITNFLKSIINFLGAVLVLVVAPIATVFILIFLVYFYWAFIGSCEYHNVDTLSSPAGKWSVARTEKHCSGDENKPPLMFALLPVGAPFREADVFVTSADYEGIWSQLSIFAKWLDDDHLLIAAPEGSALPTARDEFKGVHIQYGFYPAESDRTRDERLRRRVEKKVRFESKFSRDDGIGLPGIGCHLTVSARDGEYLDKLEVYLTAGVTFPVKSRPGSEIAYHPAHSFYDFQISARDEIWRPDKNVTAASVVGFAPSDGRSVLWMHDLNYPGIKTPGGGPAPRWDFGYTPKDPHDVVSIARQAMDGTLAVRMSLWLDDVIVVYSSEEPGDPEPVEMFERCIGDNHIFETPRPAGRGRMTPS